MAPILAPSENLPGAALWVTSLDAVVAVLAGFLIMPAVFSFGFDAASGPGLSFITLPAIFSPPCLSVRSLRHCSLCCSPSPP